MQKKKMSIISVQKEQRSNLFNNGSIHSSIVQISIIRHSYLPTSTMEMIEEVIKVTNENKQTTLLQMFVKLSRYIGLAKAVDK